jgi:hypothetical protein
MPDIKTILTIAGAAEGSYYSVRGGSKDDRYKPSFANATSGLSFGVFQFDVATNTEGKTGFRAMLDKGGIEKTAADRIYKAASTINAGALMKKADKEVVQALMVTPASKGIIDALDQQRARSCETTINAIIAQAASVWMKKLRKSAPILTPMQQGNLRLFAYLLASWNRYPANKSTFEQWLRGEKVVTQNGPKGGFQLTAPPTIDEMHAFFKSLRIWNGTQGNYQYLRDRLDPTLQSLGA